MFLIAHRGNNNHTFSENSIEAINECLDTNYIDGVEFDVRITKDKKIVLIHDAIIDFVSNGSGIVKYMTLKDLRKYKFGSDKIATLEEVLRSINSNKVILIELKEFGNDYINLVEETVKIINKYPKLNIFISSFNLLLITYLNNNYPNIKCGVIIGFGLNSSKVINHFSFNMIDYRYYKFIKKKDYTFVFGVKEKNIHKLSSDTFIITDYSYKYKDMVQ